MLYRLSGEDVSEIDGYDPDIFMTVFSDYSDIVISRGNIGVDAVDWAIYRGIISGDGTQAFKPDYTINKITAVTWLYQYDNYKNLSN